MAAAVVSALFGSYDLRMAKQWRDEDVAFRDQSVQWISDDAVRAHAWRSADVERQLRAERVASEHRACEARAEQLAAVSEQCALLCGFTVAALTNLDLPRDLAEPLLFAYAVSATIVCVSLLTAAVQCTMLLLAVTRYAGYGALEEHVKRLPLTHVEWDSPFAAWWLRTCEREQMTAYKLLLLGISLFFVYLAVLAWIQFRHSVWAASTVSVLCLAGFLTWQLRVASKWRYLLQPPSHSRESTSMSASSDADARVCGDLLHTSPTGAPRDSLSTPVGSPAVFGPSPTHSLSFRKGYPSRPGGGAGVGTTGVEAGTALLPLSPVTAVKTASHALPYPGRSVDMYK
ncbi:hypothetical protein PybrP1_005760 [[Pythium] brassicae (nom. inval.)]|nr:hypothetical protein PybrP1_005760 [[Pythium] brassicae (nom. inval.)]